jgi:hypothetical protein
MWRLSVTNGAKEKIMIVEAYMEGVSVSPSLQLSPFKGSGIGDLEIPDELVSGLTSMGSAFHDLPEWQVAWKECGVWQFATPELESFLREACPGWLY